jgi:FkbM family methyltransferase
MIDIIKTTKNWWSAIAFYLHMRDSSIVKFRSLSFHFLLTESRKNDYYCLRQIVLNKKLFPENYNLSHNEKGLFRLHGPKFDIVTDPLGVILLANAATDASITRIDQINTDLFEISWEHYKVYGSIAVLTVFQELQLGFFDCSFQNKIVLDIGGFQGETAVLFFAMGAKKVIIYEPVLEHQLIIKQNLKKNNLITELHTEGIADEDGEFVINYAMQDMNFGVSSRGSNTTQIKVRNITEVLRNSQADIAKIDCEGNEVCLTKVPIAILRLLDYYIIEAHSYSISKIIIRKFVEAGFKLNKKIPYNRSAQIYILHFEKMSFI